MKAAIFDRFQGPVTVRELADPACPDGVAIATEPGRRRFRKGDRVTRPFIIARGNCPDCLGGEATAVPRADFNLVKLPGAIGFAEAAAMCRSACRSRNTRRLPFPCWRPSIPGGYRSSARAALPR